MIKLNQVYVVGNKKQILRASINVGGKNKVLQVDGSRLKKYVSVNGKEFYISSISMDGKCHKICLTHYPTNEQIELQNFVS